MTPDAIKKAVQDVFDNERKSFWVPAEEHYNQHKFLAGFMAFMDKLDNVKWKVGGTLAVLGTVGVLGLMWAGVKLALAH